MINRTITGATAAILGALIAILPNFSPLQVCTYCMKMGMKCSWAAKAEYGVGVLVVFLAILLTFTESREIRLGISAALAMVGVLAALIANVLIGFCDGSCCEECTCNPFTVIAVTALGIVTAVIFFINTFYLAKNKNT